MSSFFNTPFHRFWLVVFLALELAAPGRAAPDKPGNRFGDWLYECRTLNKNNNFCVLTQTAVTTKGKKLVMKVTLGRYGPAQQLTLVALLPLGIYLPAGVVGRIDNSRPFNMTVRTCTAQGCEAILKVDPKLRWIMKTGRKLYIGFTARPGAKVLALPFSLAEVWLGMQAIGEQ